MTDDQKHKTYRLVLEMMTKMEPCDCCCPNAQKPVLLKPQHYYAIAREALRIGADESQDDDRAGVCAHSHVKTSNNEADLACCDSAPISNVESAQ